MSTHQAPRHRVDRPHWGPLTPYEPDFRHHGRDWLFWSLFLVLGLAAGVIVGVLL